MDDLSQPYAGEIVDSITTYDTALPTLDCPRHGRVRVVAKPHPVVSINDYVCPNCGRILWSDRFVVQGEL